MVLVAAWTCPRWASPPGGTTAWTGKLRSVWMFFESGMEILTDTGAGPRLRATTMWLSPDFSVSMENG